MVCTLSSWLFLYSRDVGYDNKWFVKIFHIVLLKTYYFLFLTWLLLCYKLKGGLLELLSIIVVLVCLYSHQLIALLVQQKPLFHNHHLKNVLFKFNTNLKLWFCFEEPTSVWVNNEKLADIAKYSGLPWIDNNKVKKNNEWYDDTNKNTMHSKQGTTEKYSCL